ncbi:uncharacterized protein BO97DRAFT_402404 [Aspergillus homomorphus CBS 101889]|uniref:Antigenic thaumatin domain protein n=1 Tax=Aspergillus homomorphus (strain CBS 101889) TaxID=1450537 RepID=A0A395I912_ASPHC|nr:hypothetical protein BO97DRAFT_402404 [Aspergillus homomorphus CBS 101889]RAL16760.1 hypothetical protein BO97DRAFT_402404 [Aspergillus homomorphus CBS 101889]
MLFSNYIRAAALFAAMASAIPIALPPTATDVQVETETTVVTEVLVAGSHGQGSHTTTTVKPTTTTAHHTSTTTHASPTASASASAVASSSSSAKGGRVEIVNNLNHTIYAWSVSNTQGKMQTLVPSGGTFTETWRTNPDGGGISIKLSSTKEVSKVLQFEYTAESETVWWDLSCINMEKNSWFTTHGFSATPSIESCPSAKCAAGDTNCSEAYQNPDDVDTLSCSSDSVIKLVLG